MSELYVLFCYVQLFLIRAPIIARKEMAMRLLDVCWRDDAGPECAIEGSRIELNYVLWRDRWYQICVLDGKAENYMCTGGKNGWTDVCWRGSLGKLRGVPLQRTSKKGNWTSLPGSTHFFNAASLQHTLILGVSALDCENGRLQNFPGLSSQLNSRDSRLF